MVDQQNFAPNFQIPTNAFVRNADPYGQILPNFLQGQQAAELLQKKRAIMSGMQQFGANPDQLDPITRMLLPIAQSNPDVAMALLPTMVSGAYKRQNKPSMVTMYQDPNTGRVSRNMQPGYTPVSMLDSQATTQLRNQGQFDTSQANVKNRFNQIMGLNVGKAANKIDMDEGSLVDQSNQLEGYLNALQVEHAQLYPQFGGMAKGRATGMMSGLTGGTTSFNTPLGDVPIPGSDPKVAAYNNKINGTIQLMSAFLKEKGKLSDKDAEQRLGQLKATLTKDPKTVAKLYDDLRGLLGAIKTNDINRVNRSYARLGIKTRLKPNPQNAQLLMQQQMMASMMAGGGQMSPEAMEPSMLQGMSDEQLQQLMSQVDE